jgi:hypothetical protein
MKGVFELIIDGQLTVFDDYRKIPDNFEHVVKFIPEIPDSPHSDHDHEDINLWNERLKKLMEKERARSN